MTSEYDLGTMIDEILNGGDGSSDPCIISDMGLVVQRDIEIHPHKNLLPSQIFFFEVSNASFRHSHDE